MLILLFFESILIFESISALAKHFDATRVWNINKPAMAVDGNCFGVIAGVLCSADL